MSELPFIKMHGTGNDYVFIDGFETSLPEDAPALARRVSDRHFGIGSDGLVLLVPPASESIDVRMRMWNADGSEGRMCGNAVRCIALWMNRQQRALTTCRIGTLSGTVEADVLSVSRSGHSGNVRLHLPAATFPSNTKQYLDDIDLPGADDQRREFTEVSVGNPHAVLFVDTLSDRCVREFGSIISAHPRFSDGINVEWVRIASPRKLEVRVWERGSGETLACGSGACAAVAAAVREGHCRTNTDIRVDLPGGTLTVRWCTPGDDNPESLQLTGPAEMSYRGVWLG